MPKNPSSPIRTVAFPPAVRTTRGQSRGAALDEVLTLARAVLADAPLGSKVEITACLGEPLCEMREPKAGQTAKCPLCECIRVAEDGDLTYPRAGNA
jgi:hypothetical protein